MGRNSCSIFHLINFLTMEQRFEKAAVAKTFNQQGFNAL
jgi:hypothetical protein